MYKTTCNIHMVILRTIKFKTASPPNSPSYVFRTINQLHIFPIANCNGGEQNGFTLPMPQVLPPHPLFLFFPKVSCTQNLHMANRLTVHIIKLFIIISLFLWLFLSQASFSHAHQIIGSHIMKLFSTRKI